MFGCWAGALISWSESSLKTIWGRDSALRLQHSWYLRPRRDRVILNKSIKWWVLWVSEVCAVRNTETSSDWRSLSSSSESELSDWWISGSITCRPYWSSQGSITLIDPSLAAGPRPLTLLWASLITFRRGLVFPHMRSSSQCFPVFPTGCWQFSPRRVCGSSSPRLPVCPSPLLVPLAAPVYWHLPCLRCVPAALLLPCAESGSVQRADRSQPRNQRSPQIGARAGEGLTWAAMVTSQE